MFPIVSHLFSSVLIEKRDFSTYFCPNFVRGQKTTHIFTGHVENIDYLWFMKTRVKKQTSIELKGNRIVIRYKSKRWSTGYTLHSERKTQIAQQFSNGRLKAAWNREEFEQANFSIQKKKQEIDNLITEAFEKNVDEITYVEAYLEDKNDQLEQLSITKNTLLVEAFE